VLIKDSLRASKKLNYVNLVVNTSNIVQPDMRETNLSSLNKQMQLSNDLATVTLDNRVEQGKSHSVSKEYLVPSIKIIKEPIFTKFINNERF
jgi:hypothetical protein